MKKYGFTIIEILIVLVIMSIISLFAVPYVIQSISDARISKVRGDFSSIRHFIQEYYYKYSKNIVETEIGQTLSNFDRVPLEYAPPVFESPSKFKISDNSAERNPMKFLEEVHDFKFSTDPWGTYYRLESFTYTLPDRIILNTTNPPARNLLKLFRIFSLNRNATDSYNLQAGELNVEFKYRLYCMNENNKSTGKNIGEIGLVYESPIISGELRRGFYSLFSPAEHALKEIDSSHFNSSSRKYYGEFTDNINNIEQLNIYLAVNLDSSDLALDVASSSNQRIALEINSLKIKGNINSILFYTAPFAGNIEFTITSAGPDRIFGTENDISENYSIKLNL
ncbi:MAG: prepilin-type N-terminal cleavage/methylation domain-containing protein [Candidatus Muiribacteriota bacterium]